MKSFIMSTAWGQSGLIVAVSPAPGQPQFEPFVLELRPVEAGLHGRVRSHEHGAIAMSDESILITHDDDGNAIDRITEHLGDGSPSAGEDDEEIKSYTNLEPIWIEARPADTVVGPVGDFFDELLDWVQRENLTLPLGDSDEE